MLRNVPVASGTDMRHFEPFAADSPVQIPPVKDFARKKTNNFVAWVLYDLSTSHH